MKLTLKHAFAAIILVLSFAAPVTAGPFEDAGTASGRGDYTTVLRLMRPFAEQGNVLAQVRLGSAYESAADYSEAAKWYRRAADQGAGLAQLFLSILYGTGRGVPQDYVLALMWTNLAGSRIDASETEGTAEVMKRRNQLSAKMTPAQIAEAQKLAREWKPTKEPR